MAETVAVLFRAEGAKIDAATIGLVELDATISEVHTSQVDATQHPVERGASIVDHLRLQPEELQLEGIISNSPISRTQQTRTITVLGTQFETSAPTASSFGAPGYAEEAFAKLRAIQEQAILVKVATHYKAYVDMALVSLSVPRDARTGDAMRFSATFRRVVIVENKSTLIKPQSNPRANKRVKSGRQALREMQHDAKVIGKAARPWTDPLTGAGKGVRDSLGKLKMPSLLENREIVPGGGIGF